MNLRMTPEKALETLGFSAFRGMQEKVVSSILSGTDTFVLMATSGGKSLCYMVPALCFERYTIVISPLVALMDDQKIQMAQKGIRAEIINADVPWDKRRQIISEAGLGNIQVLLFSPEFLANSACQEMLVENPPSFVAFDEAHCISTWGQDFRPEYCDVGQIIDDIQKKSHHHIVRAALTATASPLTVDDIIHYASLKKPEIITSPLTRDNLSIFVKPQTNQDAIDREIIADIRYLGIDKCGIIYCQRRVECDRLAEVLQNAGIPCVTHHGGMTGESRIDSATMFLTGAINVIVATIGFGMGINKSNVRYVIHNGISASPEAWYQEIGRGGRDGDEAVAITYMLPCSTPRLRFGTLRRGNSWDVALSYTKALFGNECRMRNVMECFDEKIDDCGKCDHCRGIRTPHTPVNADIFLGQVKKVTKKPESYLPLVYAVDNSFPIELFGFMQDIAFLQEYIDYDFISIPDCPPLPFAIPTGKTFGPIPENLSVPRPLESYYSSGVEGWLSLIQSRLAYNNSYLSPEAIQFIKTMRPTPDALRNRADVYLSEHLISKIAMQPRPTTRTLNRRKRTEMTLHQ